MSTLLLRSLVAALTLHSMITVRAQTVKNAPAQAAEAEFRVRIERYYAAWNTLNVDSAAPYYAKDAGLVFYDIAPLKYNGWEEYKNGVNSNFFDKVSSAKLVPYHDLKITLRGNVAWTTLTFHFSAAFKTGTVLELDCRHTAIWERRGKQWMIVHEHVSVPRPG